MTDLSTTQYVADGRPVAEPEQFAPPAPEPAREPGFLSAWWDRFLRTLRALTRGVRSEMSRWSWKSPVFTAFVPLAVGIPVLISAAIASAAQRDLLANADSVETNNSVYWVIVFTAFILTLAAVSSTCGEWTYGTIDRYFTIQPRRWVLPAAKLVTYGGLGVVVSLLTTVGILVIFPLIFPEVWGKVSIGSSEAIRLVYGVPLLTLFTITLGVGLSLLIHRAGTVVALILLWKYGIELAFTFIPGSLGTWLQRLSPFKNGELGAGQVASIETPFGGSVGSLLYFAAICTLVFVFGLWRLYRNDIRD